MDKNLLEVNKERRQLEQDIEFERCVNFLVKMIEKYGDVVLEEMEEKEATLKVKKTKRC